MPVVNCSCYDYHNDHQHHRRGSDPVLSYLHQPGIDVLNINQVLNSPGQLRENKEVPHQVLYYPRLLTIKITENFPKPPPFFKRRISNCALPSGHQILATVKIVSLSSPLEPGARFCLIEVFYVIERSLGGQTRHKAQAPHNKPESADIKSRPGETIADKTTHGPAGLVTRGCVMITK